MKRAALAVLALAAATPALAQEDDGPRFCPTRPSLGTSPCTVETGHVMLELSALDWQRDDRPYMREDRVIAADILTRIGIGKSTEVQLGWTAFGHDRQRDKTSGQVDSVNGVGDVTVGLRQLLFGPQDGKGLAAALQPFVTLPAGRYPVGHGDWGAGMVVPVQYGITKDLALQFTGEAQAAVNESGSGRHFAYSGIWGVDYEIGKKFDVTGEVMLERDHDPSGHETHALAAAAVAFRPTRTTQLDVQAVAGLNRTSPDIRLVFGGAVLF